MIVKHVPLRSVAKSNFAELASYIISSQGKSERVESVSVTNCCSHDVQASVAEVLATQMMNTRSEADKTYHLIVSFPTGERLSSEKLSDIENRVCSVLGFAEHQRMSAVHSDTDNLHIHIAINKIHPARHTIHEPYQAYKKLGDLCELLEVEYNLQRTNHTPQKSLSESRAVDMEQHTGVESLVTWVRNECLQQIENAKTWDELHQVLSESGLSVQEHGNGLVLVTDDGLAVKASTVSRDISKRKLEKKMGEFQGRKVHQPTPAQKNQESSILGKNNSGALKRYQKNPIPTRVNTTELYARYQRIQQQKLLDRREAIHRARESKSRAIADLKRSNQLRRAVIKASGASRMAKKVMYSQASTAFLSGLRDIQRKNKFEQAAIYEKCQRQVWADWLRSEALNGSSDALQALRARKPSGALAVNHPIDNDGLDGVTKKGTVIYRDGASAIRDDGNQLQLSRHSNREGMAAALKLAMSRYGKEITLNGTNEFKLAMVNVAVESGLDVVFVDPALEQYRNKLIKKGGRNGRAGQKWHDGGGLDRSNNGVVGGGGLAQSGQSAAGGYYATSGNGGGGRTTGGNGGESGTSAQSDVREVGGSPPPQSRNRLRTLSELGVVRIASGGQVLLPSDVSHNVEQPRATANNIVRWSIHSIAESAWQAADGYIKERMDKRLNISDIPNHSRYNGGTGKSVFAGIRNVDGQALLLMQDGDEVKVLPIDKRDADRMKNTKLGSLVSITDSGVKVSGRGR